MLSMAAAHVLVLHVFFLSLSTGLSDEAKVLQETDFTSAPIASSFWSDSIESADIADEIKKNSNYIFDRIKTATTMVSDDIGFTESGEAEISSEENIQSKASLYSEEIQRLKRECGINANVSESRLTKLLSKIDQLEAIDFPLFSVMSSAFFLLVIG